MVKSEELEKEYAVTGIACDKNVAKVSIFGVEDRPGIAAEIFGALAEEKISVDMIIQSAMVDGLNDIAFTIAKSDAKRAKLIIESLQNALQYREFYVTTTSSRSLPSAQACRRPRGCRAHVLRAARCRHQHRPHRHLRSEDLRHPLSTTKTPSSAACRPCTTP